jgi:arylsulfatase A-like enzyme
MKVGIVVLDTLRYDTFCSELPSIESGNLSLDEFYSTSRWTVPAHASLFTGLFPTETGTHAQNRHLTTDRPTLAERLFETGYSPVLFSNNIHIDPFFNFDRGFSNLVRGPNLQGRPTDSTDNFDWDELFSTIGDGPFRYPRALKRIIESDAPTLQTLQTGIDLFRSKAAAENSNTLNWAHKGADEHLSNPPENLFFFANLMSAHFPYEPPEGYTDEKPLETKPFHLTLRGEPVTDEEHDRHWENYKGAAQYLGDELPKLIKRIDWDALFIISDHGEMFGEHGFYGHEYGIWPELVHVPAVALGDAVPSGDIDTVTSLLDVHKTLLDLTGVQTDDFIRGRNLFEDDLDDDRAVYAESTGVGQYSPDATGIIANIPQEWNQDHYMLRTNDAMFIHDKDGDRVIDPETGDELPGRESELRERVDELRDNRRDVTGEANQQADEMPDEVEDRLEHLGYK